MTTRSIGHLIQQSRIKTWWLKIMVMRLQLCREDDTTYDFPRTLENMVAFLQGMKLRYNDGSGMQDIVTFLGTDFVENMHLKCKV
jgi:hypothetical protein